MRDSWYYSVPEGQVGPITLEELKHTLPTLPNPQDVYIWHDSLPDWIRAGDLADIVAKAKAGAAWPIAGQDDVDQDDVDQVVAGRNDAVEDAAHIESFDTAAEERTEADVPSLDGFHPDRAYSLTMPTAAPEAETDLVGKKTRGRTGQLVGAGLFLLGCAVFYLGISGSMTWAGKMIGLEIGLVNALPGAVLCAVGLLVILAHRLLLS
jgi:hypothetical protein